MSEALIFSLFNLMARGLSSAAGLLLAAGAAARKANAHGAAAREANRRPGDLSACARFVFAMGTASLVLLANVLLALALRCDAAPSLQSLNR